ncbi:HAUS augmin-like complex subunit 1 isoform 2-T4 [Morus bassanus]
MEDEEQPVTAGAGLEAAAMEDEEQRVTLWLKKIYGNQPIPQYEVNARTVSILYELAEDSEATDRDISLLIEDMKEQEAEYKAQAEYLQSILTESLHLSPFSLSEEGVRYFNAVVNSAVTLGVKDTSLVWDLKKTEKQLKVEKTIADETFQDLEFLKEKAEVFRGEIKAAEEQLAATGLEESLKHKSLVSLAQKLARLQQEIVPLKKERESYLDLTPSLPLTQVKIEEVKRELDVLDAELSKKVDQMSLEMLKPHGLHFK